MNILHQFPHDHLCIITKHFVDHAVNLLTQWHHILKHISRMKLALSTEWKQATIKGDVSWLPSSFRQYCQYYASLLAMECWWRNNISVKKSQLLVKQIYLSGIISNLTNNKNEVWKYCNISKTLGRGSIHAPLYHGGDINLHVHPRVRKLQVK